MSFALRATVHRLGMTVAGERHLTSSVPRTIDAVLQTKENEDTDSYIVCQTETVMVSIQHIDPSVR